MSSRTKHRHYVTGQKVYKKNGQFGTNQKHKSKYFPVTPFAFLFTNGGGAPLAKAKSRLGESNTRIGKKRERKIEIVTHSPTWQEPG